MALNINGTTGISGVDGSALTPSVVGSDSNTGVAFASDTVLFSTGGSERGRIDSAGRLLIGSTSVVGSSHNETRLGIHSTGHIAYFHNSTTANSITMNFQHGRATGGTVGNTLVFRNAAGTNVGEIETTNTQARTVGFSDYRMKENINNITDGITKIKSLSPKTFNYLHDTTKKVLTGFIAHELALTIPEAVTGEKDAVVTQAMIDNKDAEPEAKLGDPIYQKLCVTALIPTMTAALKEAISKIETLETKVAALEAG